MHCLYLYVHTFQNLLHCAEVTQSHPGHAVIFSEEDKQFLVLNTQTWSDWSQRQNSKLYHWGQDWIQSKGFELGNRKNWTEWTNPSSPNHTQLQHHKDCSHFSTINILGVSPFFLGLFSLPTAISSTLSIYSLYN